MTVRKEQLIIVRGGGDIATGDDSQASSVRLSGADSGNGGFPRRSAARWHFPRPCMTGAARSKG